MIGGHKDTFLRQALNLALPFVSQTQMGLQSMSFQVGTHVSL